VPWTRKFFNADPVITVPGVTVTVTPGAIVRVSVMALVPLHVSSALINVPESTLASGAVDASGLWPLLSTLLPPAFPPTSQAEKAIIASVAVSLERRNFGRDNFIHEVTANYVPILAVSWLANTPITL
jgi:hypothetical protein